MSEKPKDECGAIVMHWTGDVDPLMPAIHLRASQSVHLRPFVNSGTMSGSFGRDKIDDMYQ